jgi:hypothetical protein
MPVHVPVDGSTVWVRRWIWVAPFKATWDLAAQSFTHSSGLVMLWTDIWRWRHVVEP